MSPLQLWATLGNSEQLRATRSNSGQLLPPAPPAVGRGWQWVVVYLTSSRVSGSLGVWGPVLCNVGADISTAGRAVARPALAIKTIIVVVNTLRMDASCRGVARMVRRHGSR
jgi:hypothetical protein